MKSVILRGAIVACGVLVASAGFVQASGSDRGGKDDGKGGGGSSAVSVTEVQLEAPLTGGTTQTAAKGYAESEVVTVTKTTTNTTTTYSRLTIGVKGLTLADGAIVTFEVNGTSVGTGTVKSGRAMLRLSSKKGDTVPTVNAGDSVTVLDPDGTTQDLTGTFAAESDSND